MVGSLPAALAIASHPRGTVFFFKGGRSIGFLPRCAVLVFIACIGILREDRSFLPDCTLIVPDKNGVSL